MHYVARAYLNLTKHVLKKPVVPVVQGLLG